MKDKERIISISELARNIDLINKKNGKLQTHTLRYWEKQFSQIKPTLLDGKRRYYTKNSADLIKLIKYLKIILNSCKIIIIYLKIMINYQILIKIIINYQILIKIIINYLKIMINY